MKKSYIWYGSHPFDMDKVESVYDSNGKPYASRLLKPRKGLWGSPVDCTRSWKAWCESEDFHYPEGFRYRQMFNLKDGARVCYLNSKASVFKFVAMYFEPMVSEIMKTAITDASSKYDLLKMLDDPKENWDYVDLSFAADGFGICMPRFLKDYDAMEVSHKHHWQLIHGVFNTWDCDSICVMNKDVIELM